ncbi:endonuclease/exonuclease/phosphatase family protein, partial [bacterium]|nr:endonuclease/exonuclease/phosphatase family protein [bacterium]
SSSTNYPAFDKLIETLKPDVVCIEEVSEGWREHFEKLKHIYPYQSVRARTDNFGIGILSKYKIEHESREPIGGIGLPTAFVDLALPSNSGESRQIQIVATHPLPPVSPGATTMRDKHMHELAKRITQSQKLTILAGDFNCTPWSYIFADFVKESGLVDSRLNKGIQPTWPTMLPYLVIPIDHIFMSPSIKCTERQVQEDSGSDHYPVFAKFVI